MRATSSDGSFNTAGMTINLNDVNEPPTIVDQTFAVDENSPDGTLVGTIIASVSEPLTEEKRVTMLNLVDEGLDIAKRTYEFYKDEVVHKFTEEAKHFGNFPTLYMSLVTPGGGGQENASDPCAFTEQRLHLLTPCL